MKITVIHWNLKSISADGIKQEEIHQEKYDNNDDISVPVCKIWQFMCLLVILSICCITNNVLLAMHIQWNIRVVVIQLLLIRSQPTVAHTTTTELCHRRILWQSVWKQNKFSRWHFQMHFLEWKCTRFSIKISLKFVPMGPINNIPALVQIMAWRRPGDKPLSESMMMSLLTHICVIRHQRVNEEQTRMRLFQHEELVSKTV